MEPIQLIVLGVAIVAALGLALIARNMMAAQPTVQVVGEEQVPVVPLYFAQERPVVERDGMLIHVDDDRMKMYPNEPTTLRRVRFRTLGCYPLTGAVESDATDLAAVVLGLLASRTSERQGRAIDADASASMEQKKQEGYF